jgi:hypothetical protein
MNKPSPEFLFAYNILFTGAKNDLKDIPTRDYIFHEVLKRFYPNPVKIFQVGAIETFKAAWRVGSGWSDLIFGEYIKTHGGKLVVSDIDIDHLANSILAAQTLKYPITISCGDAIRSITEEDYDIYYLDGSNDPQETLDQFNKIKHKKCIVIVDDFSIKGTLLMQFGQYGFKVHDVANGVGVLDLRGQ